MSDRKKWGWTQTTPANEFTVIRMSMEGNFDNYIDGIIDEPTMRMRMMRSFDALNALDPHLKAGRWMDEQ